MRKLTFAILAQQYNVFVSDLVFHRRKIENHPDYNREKLNYRLFLILVFAVLFCAQLVPQEKKPSEQTTGAIKSVSLFDTSEFSGNSTERQITVGLNYDFPPYEFINAEGKPDGYTIDFVKAVAEVMNLKVTYVAKPWYEIRRMLANREIDALTGMLYSKEREERQRFSSSILTVHYSIFTRNESLGIKSLKSLKDKAVIVEQGSLMHDFMKAGKYPVKLILVNSEPEALRKLASGSGDAALVPHLQGLIIANKFKLKNVKPAVNSIFSTKLCFAVSKNDTDLANIMNEGLAIVAKTGKGKEIYEKWFGEISPDHFYTEDVFTYALFIAIFFFVTVGVFGFWNFSLKRKVDKKTFELKKSEENYRMLIEQASDAILVFDTKGNFADLNSSAVEMFGYPRNELLRLNVSNIFSAKEFLENPLRLELINTTGSFLSEHRLKHKYGNEFFAEINSKKLNDGRYQSIVRDITDRKISEIEIQKSLSEKEVLLKEIHHRVKNNLQIVSSLLSLQANKVTEKESVAALVESQNRIKSMAMIHEKLYKSKSLSMIDMSSYIINLSQQISNSYKVDKQIELKYDLQKINLNVDLAMPVGLIINELVSNAMKYAFTNKNGGELFISFSSPELQEYVLIVQDNGAGLPGSVNLENSKTLGLNLVTILTKQLNGTVEIDNTTGAKFIIKFYEPTRWQGGSDRS
ncbi:MAG: transporter substrate-binding domain-containing protein [Ignavibacteriaceae bacterium]